MKRLVLLIAAVVFTSTISAQTVTSVDTDEVKEAGTAVVADETQDVEKYIKDALMKDENLQEATIEHLKANPDTSTAIEDIMVDAGEESSTDALMTSVLGDSELSAAAVNFVKENPELLQKAMKIAGM
jgi:hypothetical protein